MNEPLLITVRQNKLIRFFCKLLLSLSLVLTLLATDLPFLGQARGLFDTWSVAEKASLKPINTTGKRLEPAVSLAGNATVLASTAGITENSEALTKAEKEIKNQASQTLWVINDIHHFSPTLFDQGNKFQEMQATSAGLDLRFGLERLQALVYQIEQEQPDALIVAGDLTLNGEYQSMLELAEAFAKIEQAGTQVFVIPGNHDISNPWASSFMGDDTIRVDQTLPQDFQTIFADFGYGDAKAQDSASLSYVAELSKHWQIFMLDSNIYSHTAGLYAPKSQGQLARKTLSWLEQELEVHQTSGKQALVILHHNSLVHFPSLNQGYTLDNASELQDLLVAFKLPITLSGHIHAQHIAQQAITEGFTLTDIATGAFGLYPNRIGIITLSQQAFAYHTTELDMASWLQQTQVTDSDLSHYALYSQNLLTASSHLVAEREIIAHHAYSPEEAAAVLDLFARMNQAMFSGNLNKQWATLIASYGELLERLTHYGNEFFNVYLQDILSLKSEEHQQLNITW